MRCAGHPGDLSYRTADKRSFRSPVEFALSVVKLTNVALPSSGFRSRAKVRPGRNFPATVSDSGDLQADPAGGSEESWSDQSEQAVYPNFSRRVFSRQSCEADDDQITCANIIR